MSLSNFHHPTTFNLFLLAAKKMCHSENLSILDPNLLST